MVDASQSHTYNQALEIINSRASTTQPKVTLVVSDLSQSGAGRWTNGTRPFCIAEALTQMGCQVKVVGFLFGEMATLNLNPRIPVHTVPGGSYPQFFRSVSQLLKHIDGDIIYAYKPKPTSFGVSLLQKLRTGCSLILDVDDWELSWHGGDEWKYRPGLKQFARDLLKSDGALRQPDYPLYLQWMEKWVCSADVVTIHNQFLKQRFGGVYIPTGKDMMLFDPSHYDAQTAKQQYGLSDYRVLMFPGAPRPYKGVEDVLMALDRLNEPDLRLVIVGGSPYDDYDKHLIQRWARWIIKLPKTPYEKMPEVIAAADIVVVPQRNNPAAKAQFPLKLTDGMAMAKPILATRVGDIPDILNDTGYLVDPDAPDQIADRIQWIFAHPEEAADQGLKARARCIEHCSIDTMARNLSTVISQLV